MISSKYLLLYIIGVVIFTTAFSSSSEHNFGDFIEEVLKIAKNLGSTDVGQIQETALNSKDGQGLSISTESEKHHLRLMNAPTTVHKFWFEKYENNVLQNLLLFFRS